MAAGFRPLACAAARPTAALFTQVDQLGAHCAQVTLLQQRFHPGAARHQLGFMDQREAAAHRMPLLADGVDGVIAGHRRVG